MFRALKSWLTPEPASRPQLVPQLGLTALEAREVPAFLAAWSPQDYVLRLTGTSGNDEAMVLQMNGLVSVPGAAGIQIKVNGQVVGMTSALSSGQVVRVTADGYDGHDKVSVVTVPFNDSRDSTYHRPLPLTANGGAGNDTLQANNWNYGEKDVLNGGSGDDRLEGFGGDDTLNGGTDHDQLVGGMGNDTLDGGTGNDWLFADNGTSMDGGTFRALNTTAAQRGGDDTLRGGDGTDYMWGEGGNDTLYGQGGNDVLYGGWGNDGLFGGSNDDHLYGEYGADRHLMWVPTLAQTYTTLHGVETQDATLVFRPGTEEWTAGEIERVDAALEILHRVTGNTTLLERSGGQVVTFFKDDGFAAGFNRGSDGSITLTDLVMNGNRTWEIGYILHEIGHNWDQESPIYTNHLAVNGWTRTNPNSSAFTRIDKYGETWWYRTGTEFASSYAATHPLDDFAETFSAYFLQRAGLPWYSSDGAGAAAIPTKVALMDGWVRSISG